MHPFRLVLAFGMSLVPFLVSGAVAEELFELLILHNNDMHGRFEETARNSGTCRDKTGAGVSPTRDKPGCVGGFARTAHEIRRYRKLAEEGKGRPVLYLNAGDTYTGSSWFSVHRWKICADFLNMLQPDAMALGNHEFDNGVKGLVPFLNAATFPIISANLDFTQEPELKVIKKSVILDVAGRKIGIVGHLTNETKILSQTDNVIFEDIVEAVRNETEVLHNEGIDIIIVLGHSGFKKDKEIARNIPLVDIVIGGHTNTFQWNGAAPDIERPEDVYPTVVIQPNGKKVPVVQAYAFTKYLGRLNVTFNQKGDLVSFEGQPILLDTIIPQDDDVLEMLDKYRPEIEALDAKVVGKSRVILDSTAQKCRKRECNFGNLISDAFVFYMASQTVESGWNKAPIALLNGGGVRTTIDPTERGGNITRGELLGALPFGTQLVSLKLKGSDLVKTLEIGVRSNGETSYGEFLQVSGLHVVYNMTQPTGSRVVSVEARCGDCKIPVYKPVVPDEIYGVVTTNFITGGGDGHYTIKDNGFDMEPQDLIDVDVVEMHVQHQDAIYPEEQGRIKFLTARDKPVSPLVDNDKVPMEHPHLHHPGASGSNRLQCWFRYLSVTILFVNIVNLL